MKGFKKKTNSTERKFQKEETRDCYYCGIKGHMIAAWPKLKEKCNLIEH